MGKSAEWRAAQAERQADPAHVFLNLGGFADERTLREELENDHRVALWRAGTVGELHLWLDSFDEGLLHISKLGNAVLRLVNSWPKERLRLRIASRIASWPDWLTADLKKTFEGDSSDVEVLHLLPLSQEQVEEAARATSGVDALDFMVAVEATETIPLAIRPVTLLLLLNLYRSGQLRGDSALRGAEVYERGCRYLCDQWDDRRDRPSGFDPARRLLVAAHVAYIGVLTGQRLIAFADPTTTLAETEIELDELSDRTTCSASRAPVMLSAEVLEDVLRHTGLFFATPRGAQWAHQSYAEFLAAWYLHQSGLPVERWQSLFFSPVPDAGVVPALREVAVWLAALNQEFASALIKRDPLSAVRADILTTDIQTVRRQLVDKLLVMATERRLFERGNTYLARLRHPGLADQLAPFIATEGQWPARLLAFDLVEACHVAELVPQLIRQTLDEDGPIRVRVESIRALRNFVTDDVRTQLRPLAFAIPEADDDDEIRGFLLQMLWSSHLSARELTALLTPQRRHNFHGAYQSFISRAFSDGLADGIRPEHLPTLLCWVMRRFQPLYYDGSETYQDAREAILAVAWKHTDQPQILRWLAAVADHLLSKFEKVALPADAERRRQVVESLVHHKRLPGDLVLTQTQPVLRRSYQMHDSAEAQPVALIGADDWEWVVTLIKSIAPSREASVVFSAAHQLLWYEVNGKGNRVADWFADLYEITQIPGFVPPPGNEWVMDVDSERAQMLRSSHQVGKRRKAEHRKRRTKRHFFRRNRVRRAIRLTAPTCPFPFNNWYWLVHGCGGIPYPKQQDVRLPVVGSGWFNFSPDLRERAVGLAERVVTQFAPRPDTVYQLNSPNGHTAAWQGALGVCWAYAPQVLARFSAETWHPWLRLLAFAGWRDPSGRATLLRAAATQYPETVTALLKTHFENLHAVDDPNNRHEYIHVKDLLANADLPTLNEAVLARIDSGQWRRAFAMEVLAHLVKAGDAAAEAWVAAIIRQADDAESLHVLTSDVVRHYLFTEPQPAVWWQTWERLAVSAPELLRRVIISVSGEPVGWDAPVPTFLSGEQYSSMLRWLVEKLGVTEENEENDWHEASSSSRLRAFRGVLVKRLTEQPSPEGWAALLALAAQLDNPYWLAHRTADARDIYARTQWLPLAPPDLVALLHDPNQRFLQTDQELLSALLAALDRVQQKMQGENPSARRLWQEAEQGAQEGGRVRQGMRVDSENDTSDYLRELLEADLTQRGAFLKREVEVRATTPVAKGERVDLYIDAYRINTHGQRISLDVLKAIIEVKHSDNKEVATALDAQLVSRYLHQHTARCGILLVTWIGPRRKDDTIEALRAELEAQATIASRGGLTVGSYVLDIRLRGMP